MADAKRDNNYVTTLLAADSTLLTTPVKLAADSVTNRLLVTGTITSTPHSTTPTVTSVSAAITSTTLLASNTSRLEAVINNDSQAILYIKHGSSASSTSYTAKLYADEVYTNDDYTGIITGIWSSANGSARITEST